MASTGADAWKKYFVGKGIIDTVMKTDSAVYNTMGTIIGYVKANDPVKVLEWGQYEARYPIKTSSGLQGFVTFNNISKPATTKATAGIKLKPQDFKTIMSGTTGFKCQVLAKSLINELDSRVDLDPRLVNYTIALTKYWSGIDNITSNEVSELYDSTMPGLAELQKDYGEMLGAIACIQKNLLDNVGFFLTNTNSTIKFPIRGNEPIIDYYIIPKPNESPILISAKSGDTTNTLKPQHILKLLEDNLKVVRWRNKPVYKIIELVAGKPIAQFPFYAINVLFPNTLSEAALNEVSLKFKASNFQTANYKVTLFSSVLKMLKFNENDPPKIGELFYVCEAFICKKLNELYAEDNKNIFKDATSSMVVYVKFKITSSKKYGQFDIMASGPTTEPSKTIKWRTKNSRNRAADKIGLQP
jgi:hypothetical protein